MTDEERDRERAIRQSVDVVISLSLIALIFYLAMSIVAPFFSVVLWAAIMAVGIHPVFAWLSAALGGRRGLAGAAIAVLGLALLLTPTALVVDSIVNSLGPLASSLRGGELTVPPPDPSVRDWPLIGSRVFEIWTQASQNFGQVAEHFAPQIREFAGSILAAGAGLVGGVLQFALGIAFAALFLGFAEPLAAASDRLAGRIASERGRQMLAMAGATTRNVTRGVLGVAVIQGGLGAVGVLAVGMPFAGVVAAILVASTIVQVPLLAFIPCIVWAWSAEPTLTAVLFTVYMLAVAFIDNVLKPVLMARGLETPMIVILIGVIGGTLTGGLLGLFTGPVILAVFHKMVTLWLGSFGEPPAAGGAPGADAGGAPGADAGGAPGAGART